MVSIASRLYRVDDAFCVKDRQMDHAWAIYPIDDTQPMMVNPVIADPDNTRTLIASAQVAGNKKSIWANLSGSKAWQYLTVIIVLGCLAYGYLIGIRGH